MTPPSTPPVDLGNDTPPVEAPDPLANAPVVEAAPGETDGTGEKMHPGLLFLILLGTVAFLYFARPVVLPVVLAWMAAMALRPLVRYLHFPTPLSALIVFCVLLAALSVAFMQLERPAARWMNEAPQHMTELRQRVQRLFPRAMHLSQATEAVSDLGATDAEKKAEAKKTQVVELKDQRGTNSILNWTGTFLAGLGEVLVLVYLLLASGDRFLQKIVRVMPTLSGKRQAVEISREIQQSISKYLFSISLINAVVGLAVALGLGFLGVPNAGMWGMVAAFVNFVPYFGPICVFILLAAVGLLTFDSPSQGMLAPVWYLMIHLVESNFVTPILLGRRFTLNPVAIFISLIFWMWLWGIPGALLAVPILVSAKIAFDRIPAISYLGELIGS